MNPPTFNIFAILACVLALGFVIGTLYGKDNNK